MLPSPEGPGFGKDLDVNQLERYRKGHNERSELLINGDEEERSAPVRCRLELEHQTMRVVGGDYGQQHMVFYGNATLRVLFPKD
jgi:hypothetical protein